jgi:hypothetical protein
MEDSTPEARRAFNGATTDCCHPAMRSIIKTLLMKGSTSIPVLCKDCINRVPNQVRGQGLHDA